MQTGQPEPRAITPVQQGVEGGRLRALDAARGLSMVLVCLAHFLEVWREQHASALTGQVPLAALTLLASPSFVALSGLLLGLAYARNPGALGQLRLRCADRGLFLLTAGHLLILPTHLRWIPEGSSPLRILFMTDTIGVALLLGPALLRSLTPRSRALLGLGLVLASWSLLFAWRLPLDSGLRPLKHALVGHEDVSSWVYNFPLLPWLGLYLVMSALGQRLEAPGASAEQRLRRAGTALLLLGVLLGAVHGALRLLPSTPGVVETLVVFSSPFRKLPPGPTYVALYGGLALHLLALVMTAERRGLLRGLLRTMAQLGRHSLFAFIVQYYVYYVGVPLLLPQARGPWPLHFLASLVLVGWLVRRWEALGWGHLLGVGLRHAASPRARERAGLPPVR